jgi:hypothetical protein
VRERGTQDPARNTRKTINPPPSKLSENHQKLAFYQQWLEWAYGWGAKHQDLKFAERDNPLLLLLLLLLTSMEKIRTNQKEKKQDSSRTNLKLVQKTMTQPHDPSRELCCWKNRNG